MHQKCSTSDSATLETIIVFIESVTFTSSNGQMSAMWICRSEFVRHERQHLHSSHFCSHLLINGSLCGTTSSVKSTMPVCRNSPNSNLFWLLCTLYNCTCKWHVQDKPRQKPNQKFKKRIITLSWHPIQGNGSFSRTRGDWDGDMGHCAAVDSNQRQELVSQLNDKKRGPLTVRKWQNGGWWRRATQSERERGEMGVKC